MDIVGSSRFVDQNHGPGWAFFATPDQVVEKVSGTVSLNCLDTAEPAHTP